MDFLDQIKLLASKVQTQLPHLQTEEATKNALVLPFIKALGYDVFDPTEVRPELDADVGIKKGEKVDYAILRDGKPIILFECKKVGTDLGLVQFSQLFRYFTVTEARFAILTNGTQYRFFTDLEERNKMDERPFLEFDIQDFKDQDTEELKKFTKPVFDVSTILNTAMDLKYTREFKRLLTDEFNAPCDELISLLSRRVYNGRMTQPIREQFSTLIRRAFHQMISERIGKSLQIALEGNQAQERELATPDPVIAAPTEDESKIITTAEEWEGFFIIRAILCQDVDPKKVTIRDGQTYCAVLFEDNNRKPLCRLWFNTAKKAIGIFNEERKEEKIPIQDLSDIYKHSDRLRKTLDIYLAKA
ncbi:type I restriction endonuclease [Mesoterricola silvestris]|uniref:Type I restriction enzyme R protein N-terminal domain-containing protein n=1 Tax=Mesoterricola silvestris TaxID=2927979 RepID=A0AA48GQH5_9BACT|nr:type I restriction endonuclease [Mesoterricola silvestris]BDU74249.1 hypothetical protein METEAL_34230 [Mesoterricola silvestris]